MRPVVERLSGLGYVLISEAILSVFWLLTYALYAVRGLGHAETVCRFTPTCRHYAEDALHRHGVGRGLWLVARRVSRCRPGGGMGWDPVPPVAHSVSSR